MSESEDQWKDTVLLNGPLFYEGFRALGAFGVASRSFLGAFGNQSPTETVA